MAAEVMAVMFVAAFIRTVFGFGEALVAVPLLALLIPIKTAAPVAVLASIVIASVVLLQDWRHIHLLSARRLVIATAFGIPLGILLLKTVPEPTVKMILAGILLLFSYYSWKYPSRFSLSDDRLAWIFGLGAGVLGGSYGMNGPPLAIYGLLRGWSPEKFRATLQGYFLPASLLGLLGYGMAGLWTARVSHLFLYSLPTILAGIFVGRSVNQRLNALQFGKCLYVGLTLIAVALLFQSFGA